jgi:hypothetical protein
VLLTAAKAVLGLPSTVMGRRLCLVLASFVIGHCSNQ